MKHFRTSLTLAALVAGITVPAQAEYSLLRGLTKTAHAFAHDLKSSLFVAGLFAAGAAGIYGYKKYAPGYTKKNYTARCLDAIIGLVSKNRIEEARKVAGNSNLEFQFYTAIIDILDAQTGTESKIMQLKTMRDDLHVDLGKAIVSGCGILAGLVGLGMMGLNIHRHAQ